MCVQVIKREFVLGPLNYPSAVLTIRREDQKAEVVAWLKSIITGLEKGDNE